MPVLIRVVGPPGSGKSLLITSLADALRARECRSASAVEREGGATVITISNGSRAVLEQPVAGERLAAVVASIDPGVHLVFAEGYAVEGAPVIEIRPVDASGHEREPSPFATITSEALASGFAAAGPGGDQAVAALADRIVRELLGRTAPDPAARDEAPAGAASLLSRIRRLGRFGRRSE
jgi:molybdopterin-guanine dinucleotide biosynthesis protein